jgi:hypothetical protein
LGSLIASSAQAGSHHFGGGGHSSGLRSAASGVSNKLSASGGRSPKGSGSGMQMLQNKLTQTSKQPARPSLSTMDVIKAGNFASDVKSRVLSHQFTPSTMDVIKAGNFLSDVKSRVLDH